MAWMSTLPAAMDGLVTALGAAPALADVTVQDGPIVTDNSKMEVIIIGFQSEENPVIAEANYAVEGMVVDPNREQYTLHCKLRVLKGNAKLVREARVRAFELLGAIVAVLAADKTLGGAVMMAVADALNLSESQGQRGLLAEIEFNIGIDAFTAA